MRKTTLYSAAAVASAALLLSACGGGSSGDSTDTAEPTTDTSAEATDEATDDASEAPEAVEGGLTVWVDETRQGPVQAAADAYMDATGVPVDLVLKNFDDIRADFTTQVPTGNGPDITVGANDWLGELVSNGVVQPVDLGGKSSEFEQTAIDAFTWDGQLYGIPYAIENIALIRNTELAAEAPATWDDVLAAGEAAGTKYPFLIQMNGEGGDPYTFYPLQTSFGSTVFKTEDGQYTAELNLAEGGAEYAEFLAANGPSGTGAFDQDRNYDIVVDAFAKGESPFIIGGPWMIQSFTDAGIEVSVDKIPSAGGQEALPFLGVQGFYLNAESKNTLDANEFLIDYLAAEDIQLAMYEAGDRPPALTAAAKTAAEDPITAGFIAAGEGAYPMPALPEMAAVWTPWGNTEAAIINGSASDPAAAWTQMISDIEAAIG